MKIRYTADKHSYRRMTSDELRQSYLVDDLFIPGQIALTYTDIDRAIIGSAVPTGSPLTLPTHKALASEYFAERREIGVINVGASGAIIVDDTTYILNNKDSLYIGLGNKNIEFQSDVHDHPAQFYIQSYPAHRSYQTRLVTKAQATKVALGNIKDANKRIIYQSIRPGIVDSCQLVMGFTELEEGNVWNTFPPHTHRRRTEIYMYFDLTDESRVFHFMGEADETRSMVLKNGEVAISPSWSVHYGCGSSSYTLIWGMGGENQAFEDMDHIDVNLIK